METVNEPNDIIKYERIDHDISKWCPGCGKYVEIKGQNCEDCMGLLDPVDCPCGEKAFMWRIEESINASSPICSNCCLKM